MSSASDLEATRAHEEPLILERHGIDYIPPGERHGKPHTLFTFWAASNVQILAISVGALAIVFGLSLPWAIFAIILGNAAGGLYMALHSVQGPRLGLPQMMQSRAQFGMYGTALPNIIVVLMYIGYFTSSAILGGQAVANLFHVTTLEGIIIINAFVLLITWFGYDMFHAYNRWVTVLSTGIFVAMLIKLVTILPKHMPAGSNTAGNILLAISVFVAWQVTWAPYVSDYSRYMPESTPAWKTFTYTYVGAVVGASLVMIIGAIAAVVASAAVTADAPSYLAGLLGSAKWLFLIIIILGVGSGNFGNLYGPYLTFMAIISPSGKLASKTTGRSARLIATTVVAIIGTIIAWQASSHFITDLSNFLVFTLYLLVPWTAINLTDFYLIRRGRYDIPELFKANGIYGEFNWFALVVYAATVLVEWPFMNNAWIVGAAAKSLGGADIAWIVGFVFAAVVYYIGARYFSPASARTGEKSAVLTSGS
ncbi:MAG: purine-cytosine permease family protein [Streptosporangiaceae bacterium]